MIFIFSTQKRPLSKELLPSPDLSYVKLIQTKRLVNFCSTFCQSTEPRDGRAEAAGGGAEDGERVPAPAEGHELQREDQGADGEVHPGDGVAQDQEPGPEDGEGQGGGQARRGAGRDHGEARQGAPGSR